MLTDAVFNADERQVIMKLEIFFNESTPLTVTIDDYLIDVELLEEAGADMNWPLGDVSSNELNFSLYNDDGIFSPTNKTGIYYGKIKTGIKVIPYISVAGDAEWLKMGVFYVSNWLASVTGINADVTAHDKLQDFFTADTLEIPILRDPTHFDAFKHLFESAALPYKISNYFSTSSIPWAFIEDSNSATLKDMTIATFAICSCDRDGDVNVKHISEFGTLRAVISDETQLISADTAQDITNMYDGAALYYNKPHVADIDSILTMRETKIDQGTVVHNKYSFTKKNMLNISNILINSQQPISIQTYVATPKTITLTTINSVAYEQEADITVYGKVLENVETTIKDEGVDKNVLEIYNNYIQTDAAAAIFKETLDRYISCDVPELTIEVKGNPLLKVGDKVKVTSAYYKLEYTGNIKRSVLRYDGALSGSIILVDSTIYGGV